MSGTATPTYGNVSQVSREVLLTSASGVQVRSFVREVLQSGANVFVHGSQITREVLVGINVQRPFAVLVWNGKASWPPYS